MSKPNQAAQMICCTEAHVQNVKSYTIRLTLTIQTAEIIYMEKHQGFIDVIRQLRVLVNIIFWLSVAETCQNVSECSDDRRTPNDDGGEHHPAEMVLQIEIVIFRGRRHCHDHVWCFIQVIKRATSEIKGHGAGRHGFDLNSLLDILWRSFCSTDFKNLQTADKFPVRQNWKKQQLCNTIDVHWLN